MGQTPDNTATAPIHAADKPKQRKQSQNIIVNDQGFPDETGHYEALLKNVDGEPILHKLKRPPPPLDEVNPQFFCLFDKATQGEKMWRDLDLSHLDPDVCD